MDGSIRRIGLVETLAGWLIGDPVYKMLLEHVLSHLFLIGFLLAISTGLDYVSQRCIDPNRSRYAFLGYHALEFVGLALKLFVVYVIVILIADQGISLWKRFCRRLQS